MRRSGIEGDPRGRSPGLMREPREPRRYLVPTTTYTLPRYDTRYLDDRSRGGEIPIGSPIYTRNFTRRFMGTSGGVEEEVIGELPVYADIFFDNSDIVRGKPTRKRYAIVGDPAEVGLPIDRRHLTLFGYTMPEDNKITYEMELMSRLYRDHPDMGYLWTKEQNQDFDLTLSIISRTSGDRLFIEQHSDAAGTLRVIAPQDQPKLHDGVDQLSPDDPAGRFPAGIQFKINAHLGSYLLRNSERFYGNLEQQIKGTWVAMAEKLGIPLDEFPIDEIDFWARRRSKGFDIGGDKLSIKQKIQESMHATRRLPRSKNAGTARPEVLGFRRRLDTFVDVGGKVSKGVLGHELVHCYTFKEGIPPLDGYGKLITEGVANAGSLVLGGISEWERKNLDSQFQAFENIGKRRQWFLIKHRKIQYETPNAILHLYLLLQRGGFAKIGELVNDTGFFPSVSRKQILKSYEAIYGESFTELVGLSKVWYDDYAGQN